MHRMPELVVLARTILKVEIVREKIRRLKEKQELSLSETRAKIRI
jgi:hypothetical protein